MTNSIRAAQVKTGLLPKLSMWSYQPNQTQVRQTLGTEQYHCPASVAPVNRKDARRESKHEK